MVSSQWITRRRALQTGLATVTLPYGAPVSAAVGEDTAALAREAYIWGYPLVLFGRYLDAYRQKGNPINQFIVQSALSTPATPGGGPNVDTIYGYTWLDLRAGPQILYVPGVGKRYYSIQLIDMYGDSFGYVGSRATGTKAGAYAIVGPRWKGALPKGVKAIRSTTDDVLTFARTFVSDEADAPAALNIQSQYGFGDLSGFPHAARPPVARPELPLPQILDLSPAGAGYFDELCQRLAADPPQGADRDILKRFAKIGIVPGARLAADDKLKALFEAAVPVADKQIKTAQYGVQINGWSVNYGMIAFQKDPLQRASTNKYGPGAHIPEEALYFSLNSGPDGLPLNGTRNYALRFAKGELPPVDAFWSLTVYGPAMNLVENPIKRYAIKGGMAGLAFGPDGSLEIQLQHAVPSQGEANWLPVPAGPFRLVLRTYQPGREILNRTYKLPPVVLAS